MKKHIRGLAVSLATLSIGIALGPLFRFPVSQEPTPLNEKTDEVIVETKPVEAPPPAADKKAQETSDLPIVIGMSQPTHWPADLQRYIKLAKKGPTKVNLELGEDIDSREVILNFPDRAVKYRVFQRYRTSMSVSFEGPHLDLEDWRHYDSPWVQLRSLDNRRFRMLASEQIDDLRFPATTKAEIIKAVRGRLGESWESRRDWILEGCDGANDNPCLVGVSSMYLRIQKNAGDGWLDVGVVEFQVPMGC